MSTLQSLTAVIALIFALSVIVQAIQEFIKDFLQTKPKSMMQALDEFMGDMLNSADVQNALKARGLDVTALEKFSTSDFRNLLDAIPFDQEKVQKLVQGGEASLDKIKDNIAGAYQGALARFQKIYEGKNKQIAAVLSMALVLILNANVIFLYEGISADPVTQQAIISKVQTIASANADVKAKENADANANAGASDDPSAQAKALEKSYQATRDQIAAVLNTDTMLVRTKLYYPDDFPSRWIKGILGLLLMGGLVSLGAPFWNDVLKGATGVNNALNGNGKKS
jgi:hypothetical protein